MAKGISYELNIQKYRLFLKKVAEKGLANITKTQFEKIFKSSFANGHASHIFNTYQKQCPDLLRQYQLLTSSKTRKTSFRCSNPSLAASTSRSAPRQSNTHHKPLLGTTTPVNNKPNWHSVYGNGGSTCFGLVNSATGYAQNANVRDNSMQVFHQQNQASPILSYNFNSTTSGIGSTRPLANNANQIVISNYSSPSGSNFTGTKVIDAHGGGDQLIRFNQPSGYVNVTPMGNFRNTNKGYFEQGESSFSNSGINNNADYHLALVNSPNSNEQNSTLEYLLHSPSNQLHGLSNILGGGNNYEFQDSTSAAAFKGNSDLAQQFINDDFIGMFLNPDNLIDQPLSDQVITNYCIILYLITLI